MSSNTPIKFFTARASTYLAEKIAKSFGTELGRTSVFQFSDGEFQPAYDESVRGCTVFIIQSTFPPAENLLVGQGLKPEYVLLVLAYLAG